MFDFLQFWINISIFEKIYLICIKDSVTTKHTQ